MAVCCMLYASMSVGISVGMLYGCCMLYERTSGVSRHPPRNQSDILSSQKTLDIHHELGSEDLVRDFIMFMLYDWLLSPAQGEAWLKSKEIFRD